MKDGATGPKRAISRLDLLVIVGVVRRALRVSCATYRFRAADVDGRRIKRVLYVRCIKLLDHFHAGAAVFCDLIDVSAFHEAHADVGMAKAVGGAPVPVAVKLEFCSGENPVEQLDVVAGKNVLGGLRQFPLWG